MIKEEKPLAFQNNNIFQDIPKGKSENQIVNKFFVRDKFCIAA
jgi:hypothetical protein